MSSVIRAFYNEAQVGLDEGFILRLVIDFGTIDRLEGLFGRPMDELLGELSKKTSTMGKFLWAMTRAHHADLSLDQVAGLLFSKDHGAAIAATIGNLVRQTFNIGEPDSKGGEGEQSSRPPRAKAKRSAGTSRASSRNGARPSSAPRTSGRKRRVRS